LGGPGRERPDAAPPLRAEELSAGGIGAPALVVRGRPAALPDEQVPDVRVVERPQDVRGALDVERQRALRGNALDDRALVGEVLALDALPQRRDLRVERRGASDHPEDAADALLARA